MSVAAADQRTDRPFGAPVVAQPIDYDNPQHGKWLPTFRRLVLPADPETRGARLLTWALAVALASLYLYALLCYWAPAHPGVDQNGYFVGGRQFAETLSSGLPQTTDFDFVGRMYIRADSGMNYPKYPLGLPILFAFCIWLQPLWNLVGWDGHDVAHLISPVSAALATLGVFAFVRRIAGGYVGLLAMLVLGLSQVMLTLSINPNSHALGTCLTAWGFYAMVRWLETGSLWRGVLCSFILGYAYLVRYTEGLQALPLAVAMLFAAVWVRPGLIRSLSTVGGVALFVLFAYITGRVVGGYVNLDKSWMKPLAENNGRPFIELIGLVSAAALVSLFIHPRSLWRLLLIGFAWLVPVLYQTIFNMVAMHAFTSYAGTNESTGFDLDYFFANWEKMIRVLNDQGLFFIAPIGLIGLIATFRKMPMVATILTLWFVPSVLLYTAYYWAPDQWGVAYSRFILTELPALIIPAAWLLGRFINEASSASNSQRFSFLWPLAGLALVVIGVGSAAYFTRELSPQRDALWWATAAPSLTIGVAGVALLLAYLRPLRPFFAGQLSHPIPRLAVGVAVFVATGVASFRAVNGTEWGQRIIPRANLEAQSIENKNLAQLGKAARKIIPADAVVFADGDRLHHLQWLSKWEMFPADGFNPETVRRFLFRATPDESEPDPIDPGRLNFMRGVYADKDQPALLAAENKIMADALAAGRKVFLVLNEPTAKAFIQKFIASSAKRQGTVFESKVRDTVYDTIMPMTPDELLEPSERPKMPVGRNGRAMAAPFITRATTAWQIVEVFEKKAEPTTKPAAQADAQ